MPLQRALSESVVVITGASGGIGAATAVALAEQRARVVLAARRMAAVDEIAARCAARGGEALAVATDVTDPAAVEALAKAAVERFGRIDAWINNAAVALYAPLADAPLEEVRRVVDVNLFGYLHGVQAALPRLRAAGGGVIVNVASVLADITTPFLGPYNITKHAVRALSENLRQELISEPISVCTVNPASIDTPLYRHAGNRTGHAVGPIPPVYPPELVANTIVAALRHPRREIYAGRLGRLAAWQWNLAPRLTERAAAVLGRLAVVRGRPVPSTTGNLFTAPEEPVREDGGYRGQERTSARTAAAVGGAATVVAAAVAARRVHRGEEPG